MNALIYLRISGPVMTGDDLEHLNTLYLHAVACEFTVTEVWPVYDLENKGEQHNSWHNAIQDLREERFDVILCWDYEMDELTSLYRDPTNQ